MKYNILQTNLNEFKRECKLLFSERFIDTNIEEYSNSCINIKKDILGVVFPNNEKEIVELIKLSNKLEIPLYSISTGHNWGYGSKNPVVDNCIIVELSKMKNISIDEELSIITVEPGVTQGDLHAFFIKNKLNYMVPVHGGGPNCSIVANAIERGYGITPQADHFGAVNNIKAVLPNGDIYESALAYKGCSDIDKSFKYVFGPYLDGIFTQSNLGIITEMTINIVKKPESVSNFYFWVDKEENMENAVSAIQNLLRDLGSNIGSINLMNDKRVISMMGDFPNELAENNLLPEKWVEEKSKKNMVSKWMGTGAIYGKKNVVKTVEKIIKKELKPFSKRIMFFNENRINIVKKIATLLPGSLGKRLTKVGETIGLAVDILTGKPSNVALNLAHWKSKHANTKSYNPANDECGLIWYSPLVVMKPVKVREYVEMVKEICLKNNIDPLITLTSISDKIFDSTVPILFGNDYEQNAKTCYYELYDEGVKKGFVPYRVGIDHMNKAIDEESSFWKLARDIKEKIDPKNIISPGRYSTYEKNLK